MGGGAAGVTAATASRILPGVVVLEGDGVGDAYIIMELGWPSPSSPNGLVDRPEGTPSSKGFVLIAVGGLFDATAAFISWFINIKHYFSSWRRCRHRRSSLRQLSCRGAFPPKFTFPPPSFHLPAKKLSLPPNIFATCNDVSTSSTSYGRTDCQIILCCLRFTVCSAFSL